MRIKHILTTVMMGVLLSATVSMGRTYTANVSFWNDNYSTLSINGNVIFTNRSSLYSESSTQEKQLPIHMPMAPSFDSETSVPGVNGSSMYSEPSSQKNSNNGGETVLGVTNTFVIETVRGYYDNAQEAEEMGSLNKSTFTVNLDSVLRKCMNEGSEIQNSNYGNVGSDITIYVNGVIGSVTIQGCGYGTSVSSNEAIANQEYEKKEDAEDEMESLELQGMGAYLKSLDEGYEK